MVLIIRKTRIRAYVWMAIFLALWSIPGESSLVHAQTAVPVYWRYDAPGPIDLVEISDVNHDGIDEFLVVADEQFVIALGSDGKPLWPSPFRAEEPITHIAAVDIVGRDPQNDEFILGTDNHLLLLDSQGNQIWQRSVSESPAIIRPLTTSEGDGEDILVAHSNGHLRRFNGDGRQVWQYTFSDAPADIASPFLEVTDLNRDGKEETIFGYFSEVGFSKLALIDFRGQQLWERSHSGRISALSVVEFDPSGPLEIAVSTTLQRVYIYTIDGTRRWPYRTPNKPITMMVPTKVDGQPALVIATSVGTLIAYDKQGRRIWTGQYADSPTYPISRVSSPETIAQNNHPVAIAIVRSQDIETTQSADVVLLDDGGRRLEPSYPTSDAKGLSRLVDINRDGISELLLAGFATLELLDPGIGARQYSASWDYRLGAEPRSAVLANIDSDSEQELLVGTNDGRLHALENDGSVNWVADLGGVVSELAIARNVAETLPDIVAVHNDISVDQDGTEFAEGWVEVLRPDSRQIWFAKFDDLVSSILVADINRSGPPELIVGTTAGQVMAYSINGDEFWRTSIGSSVNHLIAIEAIRGTELFASTGANTIVRLNNKGTGTARATGFLEDIASLDQITQDESLVPMLFAGVEDGTLRGITTRGNQIWQIPLNGLPVSTLPASNALFMATDEQSLMKVDLEGNILWRISEIGHISSLYWGDLDGDVRPDIAIGTRDGEIRLITDDGNTSWDVLNVASEVFYIGAFRRLPDLQSELVAITDSGVVQLFRSSANRPPLLINPRATVDQNQYELSISLIEVDGDPVTVNLEIYNASLSQWAAQGEQEAASGVATLSWAVSVPSEVTEVRYRFTYDDGSHQGTVEPEVGPPPMMANPFLPGLLIFLVTLAVLGVGGIFLYQSRSSYLRARRFFRRLRQQPQNALELLEIEFSKTRASPEFLLTLAGRARYEENPPIATLVDGLYLLSARPEAAVQIINSAIEDADEQSLTWRYLEEWKLTFGIGRVLLSSPTTTELALLLPQVSQLVQVKKEKHRHTESIEGLIPVLRSLRDSERVDSVNDRLVYLNEAIGLLRQLRHQLLSRPVQIENTLVSALVDRLMGLVTAEIEELQGRAQLLIRLMTKRLIPDEETVVALEIHNIGQASAERVSVKLSDNPAFLASETQQVIPFLPSGRARQIYFTIQPKIVDNFRIAFTIDYDDRHGGGKRLDFADMVHLLAPVQEFNPVINPYSPGMPLRRKSSVFFGRSELFDFIRQNIGSPAQRNVLILVGQRRTGKTSALLQLDEHLSETILPVFIDCQSLGVTPGMPALFHDLAWVISDTLAAEGFELPVPDPAEWQIDPAGRFQRSFLSEARNLLPQETTILLIFDEFEAFENLVNDGILPATMFTYFRHLMQHSKGLSFIFAGTHRLEEMSTDYWSVLFNTALYHQVGFLSNQAAIRLMRDPVAPNLIYDDLAIDKILRVTAGHPYFLQLVCYSLVNRANNREKAYITISDVNASLDEMLRLGEVHFAYLWQRSSPPERALLAAMSRLMDLETRSRTVDLVNYLSQYSIHLDPTEVTAGLARLVQREIIREITEDGSHRYELRIGLIGLWVARNKSLSRLYQQTNVFNKVGSPPKR